jgi:hypothetical protein
VLLNDLKTAVNELLVSLGTSTAALDLYCDPAGDDTNPGTPALPVRQPAAALAQLPRRLRHRATIHLAPGHYQGFSVTGFLFDPQDDGTQVGLALAGTFVPAALTTGTPTGTSTSAANGDSIAPSWAVLVDSGQSWTPDDLRGRFLEITNGAGAGQLLPIAHNDATSIWVLTTLWSAVPAGSEYALHDQGSVIDTPIQVPNALAAVGAAPRPPTSACVVVAGNLGSPRIPYLRVERLKIDLSGSGPASIGADVQATPVTALQHCTFTADQGVCVQSAGPGSSFRIQQCVIRMAGDATGVALGGGTAVSGPSASIVGCLFDSHAQGTGMLDIGGGNNVTVLYCESNATTGVFLSGPCFVTLERTRFLGDGSCSQQIKARAQNGNPGHSVLQVRPGSGVEISGLAASNAVELEGPHCAIFDGALNGTGNLGAFRLSTGARVRLSAQSMITGVSEIVLDGGPAQTIAAMRAASPPYLRSELLTIIHQ